MPHPEHDRRLPSIVRTPLHALAWLGVLASGCTWTLDLEDRDCRLDTHCSVDGSSICVAGACVAAPPSSTSSGNDSTTTSVGGTTLVPGTASTLDLAQTDDTSSGSDETSGLVAANTDETTATDASTGAEASASSGVSDGSTTGADDETTSGCDTGDCGTSTLAADASSTGDASSETSAEPEEIPLLIPNGDFEVDAAGWARHGPGSTTAISLTTDQAHGGSQSLFVTGRQEPWHGIMSQVTSRFRENVRYIIRAWLLVAGEVEEIEMRMTVLLNCPAEGETFHQIGVTSASGLEWREIVGSFRVEAGCDPSEVRVYFEGAVVGTPPDAEYLDFYLDDVTVEARPD